MSYLNSLFYSGIKNLFFKNFLSNAISRSHVKEMKEAYTFEWMVFKDLCYSGVVLHKSINNGNPVHFKIKFSALIKIFWWSTKSKEMAPFLEIHSCQSYGEDKWKEDPKLKKFLTEWLQRMYKDNPYTNEIGEVYDEYWIPYKETTECKHMMKLWTELLHEELV